MRPNARLRLICFPSSVLLSFAISFQLGSFLLCNHIDKSKTDLSNYTDISKMTGGMFLKQFIFIFNILTSPTLCKNKAIPVRGRRGL
jgi:hypothetical protein